jgi:UDP-glucose 4-epimerase
MELLKSFENNSGITIKYKFMPRRDGDLAAFWADTSKAFKKMDWQPEKSINQICTDTWRWHKLNPTGYELK